LRVVANFARVGGVSGNLSLARTTREINEIGLWHRPIRLEFSSTNSKSVTRTYIDKSSKYKHDALRCTEGRVRIALQSTNAEKLGKIRPDYSNSVLISKSLMTKIIPTNPKVEFTASRLFASWLAEQNASIAFTTYQAGKLFFVGLNAQGELAIFNRNLSRVMGIAVHDQTLWIATLWQLWRFESALKQGEKFSEHDRYYVPQLAYTTGDIDVHDVAVNANGEPIFISTLFSCIAKPDPKYSFQPIWKPAFVSKYAAEDRCHLNGLAMRDGEPAYVSCVGRSDANEGWREHRRAGGLIIDVVNNEIVCDGLSMPHSPRWHRGKLYLVNAGSGEFGYVDFVTNKFVPIAFCPGFLRGLSFVGDYAVVGLSKQRKNSTLSDLELDQRLAERGVSARCAIQIIDLTRGDVVHELRIEGSIEELFDTATIPGARNCGSVGFVSDEIRHTLSLPPSLDSD
jgi:uncharacterized protein (TIGR03032 family)